MAAFSVSVGTAATRETGTNPLAMPAPAGGVAVGDILFFHVTQWGNAASLTEYTGLTNLETHSQDVGTAAQTVYNVWYKIADSSDAAQSTFNFTAGGSTDVDAVGSVTRVRGQAVTSPVDSNEVAATSATVTVAGLTPSKRPSLVMFFIGSFTDGSSVTTSAYAVATDNGSWTEAYDAIHFTNNVVHAMAYSERDSVNATGNATATLSGSEKHHGVLVLVTPEDVAASPVLPAAIVEIDPPIPAIAAGATPVLPVAIVEIEPPVFSVSQSDRSIRNPDKSSAPSVVNPDKS